jgi:CRISPR-associated protein Cas5h
MANALGLERDDYSLQERYEISIKPLNVPEKTQDMVLMKKLKSNISSKERKLSKEINENKKQISDLTKEELQAYNKLRRIRSTSAPFVKEFITQVDCTIYVIGEYKDLIELKHALEDPARPLYIGASDDFVVISNIIIVDITKAKSDVLDSIVRIDSIIQPIDKKRVIGRIPYKFKAINPTKKDYAREDVVIAAPLPMNKLLMNDKVDCYNIDGEYVAFR